MIESAMSSCVSWVVPMLAAAADAGAAAAGGVEGAADAAGHAAEGGGGHAAIWQALAAVLMLLGGALVAGAIFERLKQSAMLGYLVAGTLLGPNALAVIGREQEHIVSGLAELGVALLLFAIGLEFSVRRLVRMGKVALVGGMGQVVATTLIAAGIWYLMHGEGPAAIAIGLILTMSSTACVLRVLMDKGMLDSMHGRGALGVLLMQDVAVVPAVLIVTLLAAGGTAGQVVVGLVKAAGMIVLLIGALWVLTNKVLPPILRAPTLAANRELLILLATVLALGATAAAHWMGLSPAMGAFVAGILLAESPFAAQIRADVGALRTLFVTLFFTSIGMLGNPGWIMHNALPVIAMVAAIVIGKTIITAAVIRLVGYNTRNATATGLSLAQVGEFSFVLAMVAATAVGDKPAVIGEQTFNLIVSATLVTLFVTPYMVAYAPAAGRWVERLLGGARAMPAAGQPAPAGATGGAEAPAGQTVADAHHAANGAEDGGAHAHGEDAHGGTSLRDHVILIGFGPAGQRVASAMLKLKRDTIVIDIQPRNIEAAKQFGLHAQLGDATSDGVLQHAGLAHAAAVVVAIPDARTVTDVVHHIRAAAPAVPIIARARQHVYGFDIAIAGAHVVVDEEMLVGRKLGRECAHWIRHGRSSAAHDETGAIYGSMSTEPLAGGGDDD